MSGIDDGDVRIGDLGLARPGDYATVDHRSSPTKPLTKATFGNFTKDVGTASYIAPEVRSTGSGKYSEKADMFSLGVIFLEMNVPFSTGMERAEALSLLQTAGYTPPSALLAAEKAAQAKVLMHLVQIKPSLRPSCSELLQSGEIPDQAEDESMRAARGLLNDPKSHYRAQFISSLFAKVRIPHNNCSSFFPTLGAVRSQELIMCRVSIRVLGQLSEIRSN